MHKNAGFYNNLCIEWSLCEFNLFYDRRAMRGKLEVRVKEVYLGKRYVNKILKYIMKSCSRIVKFFIFFNFITKFRVTQGPQEVKVNREPKEER